MSTDVTRLGEARQVSPRDLDQSEERIMRTRRHGEMGLYSTSVIFGSWAPGTDGAGDLMARTTKS